MNAIRTILTLNDDSNIVEFLGALLEAAGFRSLYTTDSYQALSVLLKEPVDLLIQDIVRRDIDGFQLYSLIKSEEQLRDMPMVITTGCVAQVTNVELAGRLGECLYRVEFKPDPPKVLYVQSFMLMPIDFKRFPDAIKRVLEKCSRSFLTEEERTFRYERFWSQATG